MRFYWVPLALLLGACATSAPKPHYASAEMGKHVVDANDQVAVVLTAPDSAAMSPMDRERLRQSVASAIVARKVLETADATTNLYDVEIEITRYERGNAVARLMLAGLGQIHIDSHVRLKQRDTGAIVSEFDLDKTFAWGGAVGGVTEIQEVEQGFAAGVADALSGGAKKAK